MHWSMWFGTSYYFLFLHIPISIIDNSFDKVFDEEVKDEVEHRAVNTFGVHSFLLFSGYSH